MSQIHLSFMLVQSHWSHISLPSMGLHCCNWEQNLDLDTDFNITQLKNIVFQRFYHNFKGGSSYKPLVPESKHSPSS